MSGRDTRIILPIHWTDWAFLPASRRYCPLSSTCSSQHREAVDDNWPTSIHQARSWDIPTTEPVTRQSCALLPGETAHRSNKIRYINLQETNISQDEAETNQCHHVWSQPSRKEFGSEIPLELLLASRSGLSIRSYSRSASRYNEIERTCPHSDICRTLDELVLLERRTHELLFLGSIVSKILLERGFVAVLLSTRMFDWWRKISHDKDNGCNNYCYARLRCYTLSENVPVR